jgi:hypothetical protein
MRRFSALAVGAVGVAAGGYIGLVTGAFAPDLNIGRRTQPLGPRRIDIDAPRELVFDIIAAPYQLAQPRSFADKVHVLERGTDMVLAAHRTPVRWGLVATTVETVRFSRPERVDFRLVRGPVPYVVERFTLTTWNEGTTLIYEGELGTDLWGAGKRWGNIVAATWERVVEGTFASVKAEAERRANLTRRSTST